VRLRTSTVCEGFYKKGIAVTVTLTALKIWPGASGAAGTLTE
jgi:hypothetical protein